MQGQPACCPCPQCSILLCPHHLPPLGNTQGQPPLLSLPWHNLQEKGLWSTVQGTRDQSASRHHWCWKQLHLYGCKGFQLKECILGISGMEMEQDLMGRVIRGETRDMGTRPPRTGGQQDLLLIQELVCRSRGRLENWCWGESVLPALASWRGLCFGMDLWAQGSPISNLD